MDVREQSAQDDLEEVIRVALGSNGRQVFSNLRVVVAEDSKDGHTVNLQPVTKMQVRDQFGAISQMALPMLLDCPIAFLGGGGVTSTHPIAKGDEGTVSFSAAPIDGWHQQGGVQAQIDGRQHSLSDATYHPGGRSDPRKLKQVEPGVHQVRTDDKKNVISHGPDGTHHKAVDPSTPEASDTYDPQKQATKYHDHKLHPSDGLLSRAVDGDTEHAVSNTHGEGPKLSAKNGGTVINAHPDGATIQAPNASLDKDTGDLSNQGKHTAKGDILSSTGNITAALGNIMAPSGSVSGQSGSFGGFRFGGGGGKSGGAGDVAFGSVEATSGPLRGPYVDTNKVYTVAELNAVFPPSADISGRRAVVSDATSPSFLKQLQGGGQQGSPAICLYAMTVDNAGNQSQGYWWVAG